MSIRNVRIIARSQAMRLAAHVAVVVPRWTAGSAACVRGVPFG